jgi:C4-dicarboxylate-binding protein DctP
MTLRRLLLLLVVLGMAIFLVACGQEEAAEEAAPVAEAEEATADGEFPPVIDMDIPFDEPMVLRLAHDDPINWPGKDAPDPEHAFAVMFKDYVERQTSGMVQIEMFGAGTLGSYRQTLEMLQIGAMDINIGTGSIGSFFPPFQVFTIPYVFREANVASYVFENTQFWQDLMDQMEEETGIKVLAMGSNGVRNLTNNVRPIRTPADMEGIKFRVMENPVYVNMIESMGGSAVPIAWNELYTALQTGVVDGQENPVGVIAFGRLYEVQEYLTMNGHVWSENVMSINADLFDRLPIGVQQIISMGARYGARANNVAEAFQSNILYFETVAEEMEVYFPTPSQMQQFKEASQPAVIEYLRSEIGEDVVDGFLAAVAEAETELGFRR